jgi:hypothetical protein
MHLDPLAEPFFAVAFFICSLVGCLFFAGGLAEYRAYKTRRDHEHETATTQQYVEKKSEARQHPAIGTGLGLMLITPTFLLNVQFGFGLITALVAFVAIELIPQHRRLSRVPFVVPEYNDDNIHELDLKDGDNNHG